MSFFPLLNLIETSVVWLLPVIARHTVTVPSVIEARDQAILMTLPPPPVSIGANFFALIHTSQIDGLIPEGRQI